MIHMNMILINFFSLIQFLIVKVLILYMFLEIKFKFILENVIVSWYDEITLILKNK
jgi:hypothetical protein